MKSIVYYLLIFITIVFGVLVLTQFLPKTPESTAQNFEVKVKEHTDNQGWYYEIYQKERLLIKQENIPGISGNQLFTSQKDAKTIGLLVLNKLKNKNNPSISVSELENCNIQFKR